MLSPGILIYRTDAGRCLAIAALVILCACSERPSEQVRGTRSASGLGQGMAPALRQIPLAPAAATDAQQDPTTLYVLGARYADGIGVAPDPARAVALWRKAAEQGHAESQVSLGWMYTLGQGVAQDPVAAVQWYQRAALQGHAAGQLYLGVKLRDGEGIERDRVLAYAWLSLAAAGDGAPSAIRLAITLRDALGRELTAEELAAGQRLAASWRRGQLLSR